VWCSHVCETTSASSAQADEMGGGPLHEVTFYARDVT